MNYQPFTIFSHSTNGVQIPKGVNFHLIGLSDNDITIPAPESLKDFTTWQMNRFSSVRRSLRHEKVCDVI
jgi:hypothetical protein